MEYLNVPSLVKDKLLVKTVKSNDILTFGRSTLETTGNGLFPILVKDMKWGVSAQELINFEEDIVNAE